MVCVQYGFTLIYSIDSDSFLQELFLYAIDFYKFATR